MGPTAKPEDGSRAQARPRRSRRNHLLALFTASLILIWNSAAYCQDASESALGDPAPQAMEDPSLSNSRLFAPSQSDAGVAAVLPAKAHRGANCSATNPCALPTPARDRVVVAQGKP